VEGGTTTLPRTADPEAERFLYGLTAEFEHAEDLIVASRRTREAGYRRVDAYTPFPVEGLEEALGLRDVSVPYVMLAAGIIGCLMGFGLLYYSMVFDYPLNVGGRPGNPRDFAWPMYIPITFEITVLTTALTGVVAMFWLNGLPQPYHPVFDAPNFQEATSSRFFLCIEARDPRFEPQETRRFMETLGALRVSEVELRK
jgi:hypothetical protein